MTIEQSAWFCPACQKHHAPHVETCPGSIGVTPQYQPLPYPGWHDRVGTTPDVCGCRGACLNAACPRGLTATCAVPGLNAVIVSGVATTRGTQ